MFVQSSQGKLAGMESASSRAQQWPLVSRPPPPWLTRNWELPAPSLTGFFSLQSVPSPGPFLSLLPAGHSPGSLVHTQGFQRGAPVLPSSREPGDLVYNTLAISCPCLLHHARVASPP